MGDNAISCIYYINSSNYKIFRGWRKCWRNQSGRASCRKWIFFEDNSAYAISLYNVWIGSISGDLFFTTIFYFILPLAATLPFSFSLSDESKSGYLRQMTLKKGQMRYYFAKYIVTFTSGFLLAAIPLLTNVIITACYIPAYKPDPLEQLYSGQYYGQYLANIFYSEPFAFMIIFILIPGLFCGLWADLSMCLSFL